MRLSRRINIGSVQSRPAEVREHERKSQSQRPDQAMPAGRAACGEGMDKVCSERAARVEGLESVVDDSGGEVRVARQRCGGMVGQK